MTREYETETRRLMIARLKLACGDDGTDNYGVIVDSADPAATLAELVDIVMDAREEAADVYRSVQSEVRRVRGGHCED